jgi:hypothetical protein
MKKTITHNTKILAESVGYDKFNIIHSVIPTGEIRKTCTMETLHEWIKTNYQMLVETHYDDSQLWGFSLKKYDEFWLDGDSMFETEEIAFDEGLQRALYEIKCNKLCLSGQ